MPALYMKMWRDLWYFRAQAFAIAMVVAGGVATLVMSLATLDALNSMRSGFYHQQNFADLFVRVSRAPERLIQRISQIEGVSRAESRVVAPVKLEVEDFREPITGLLLSAEANAGDWQLNRLVLMAGRMPSANGHHEVVITEAFADARGLGPGDSIKAIINGRLQSLMITGVVLSPEYVYQIRPGSFFPDFGRFAVLWMNRRQLEAAYDMDGAFNELSIKLNSGVHPQRVKDELDRMLSPYGGLGAYGRDEQISDRYLSEEIRSLKVMGAIFPAVFLAVAVFLLNVSLSRMMNTQREQIALLKAFGYGNRVIVLHFMGLVMAIIVLGSMMGFAGGHFLGFQLTRLYMDFYRFPELLYRFDLSYLLLGSGLSALVAVLGTIKAVDRAVKIPPAEAMRPESPPLYKPSFMERMGLHKHLEVLPRIVVRNMERKGLKTLVAIAGVALAVAIMMVGNFQGDALDHMIDVQFVKARKYDLRVDFVEQEGPDARFELLHLPGVREVEAYRDVPVELVNGVYRERIALTGLDPDSRLIHVLDKDLQKVEIPPKGLLMSRYLARQMQLGEGDVVQVKVLDGRRQTLSLPLVRIVDEFLGVASYMQLDSLNKALLDGDRISGVYLAVDGGEKDRVNELLRDRPQVAGVIGRKDAIDNFYKSMAEVMLTFTFFNALMANIIAFGVIYNAARISLSERGRELASMRVLGFRQSEVARVLLGELLLITLLAIPPGFAIGYGLCAWITANMQNDLYRIPLVLQADTYANAAVGVFIATLLSAWLVSRKLAHLDLVAVLKTRE